MIKSIQVAQRISKQLDIDNMEILEEYNLHNCFMSIQNTDLTIHVKNVLICSIIYSYDVSSKWSDLNKTSFEDKINILKGLNADLKEPAYYEFIELRNEDINDCIGEFLDIQTDWRFAQVMRSRDFHSKALKEKEPEFNGLDEDKTIKAKENIGKLLREGLNHRKLADEYLKQIEADYVSLNFRTQQDFGANYVNQTLSFIDTSKKIVPESWRDFIRELNERKKKFN